eukprot:scaffold3312_cov225-Alexandrium_tamarense.AAC.2
MSDRSAVSFGGMRELQGKVMRKSLSTVRSRRQQLTSSMDQRSNADNPRPLRSSHDIVDATPASFQTSHCACASAQFQTNKTGWSCIFSPFRQIVGATPASFQATSHCNAHPPQFKPTKLAGVASSQLSVKLSVQLQPVSRPLLNAAAHPPQFKPTKLAGVASSHLSVKLSVQLQPVSKLPTTPAHPPQFKPTKLAGVASSQLSVKLSVQLQPASKLPTAPAHPPQFKPTKLAGVASSHLSVKLSVQLQPVSKPLPTAMRILRNSRL